MKLILLQEVAGLGAPGDVVEVKDGYGRNYLVPRKFATRWTRGGEREVTSIRRARESRQVRDLGQADEIKARLEGLTVRLPVRSGANGRLFGAVTPGGIADAVQAAGVEVDRRRIELAAPIKALGQHDVVVRLHPEVTARIRLDVVPS